MPFEAFQSEVALPMSGRVHYVYKDHGIDGTFTSIRGEEISFDGEWSEFRSIANLHEGYLFLSYIVENEYWIGLNILVIREGH